MSSDSAFFLGNYWTHGASWGCFSGPRGDMAHGQHNHHCPTITRGTFCRKPIISSEYSITGWWFGTRIWWLFIFWEFHNPNWRTPSFFRGVGIPPTRLNQSILPYTPPAFNGSFSRRFAPAGIGRSLCSDVRKIQGHSVAQRNAERKPFRDAGTEGIFFTGQAGQ